MIPIMRPQQPPLRKLTKHIQYIDNSRWYSNNGRLVKEYEGRLAERFNAPVVATSSGTSALTAAIMALGLPKRSLIACPSWTFVATPAAIVAAGHVPYFCDTPDHLMVDNTDFKAFVGVAPFGAPLLNTHKASHWLGGRPVIIDAAAGFDSFVNLVGSVPIVFSTHCTKVFGTGEGGFVTCTDTAFLSAVSTIINHGIAPDRSVPTAGINGKMSEYHAALGLAELDAWPEKRAKWKQVQQWYGDRSPYVTSTHLVAVPDAVEAKKILSAKGIDTRVAWYGCHQHEAYAYYPQADLSTTSNLMRTQLALPKYVDMTQHDVEYILEGLKSCGLQ